MHARMLGSTDLAVSEFAMGCNKLGSLSAHQTKRSAVRLVHAAMDAGIHLFDTADAYSSGASESVLGTALRGKPSAIIATKVGYRFTERSPCAHVAHAVLSKAQSALLGRTAPSAYESQDFSPGYVRSAVYASLKRLQRGHIDLLQFHSPPSAASCDLPAVISELIAAGTVRYFGVGCESLSVAQSWSTVDRVAAIQLQFGVLDPLAAEELIPELSAANVGVLARGILGGGLIARYLRGQRPGIEPQRIRRLDRLRVLADTTGADIAQLAVWYAQYSADVDSIVLGISDADQVAAAARFAGAPRPDDATITALQAIVADLEPA